MLHLSYNHYAWPSPRARLVAIKLGLDTVKPVDGSRKIKLTHGEAIIRLAHRANKTTDQFLTMSRVDSLIALGCWKKRDFNGNKIPHCPLGLNLRY